jgi:hypothetical protein
MSLFGDIFNVFTFLRTRRTKMTVEITHELVDSDAPRVIDLGDIRPAPKVYKLKVYTTNHGEQTEYMTSLAIEATDGSVSDRVEPGTSAWAVQPREPLVAEVPIRRLKIDLTDVEFRVTAYLTSGEVSSEPTRLDDALLAELQEHNGRC